jgi:hypothetical protein
MTQDQVAHESTYHIYAGRRGDRSVTGGGRRSIAPQAPHIGSQVLRIGFEPEKKGKSARR